MEVIQLNASFEIAQYRLNASSAVIELANGEIVVHAQYTFHNVEGRQTGPVILLRMIVTQQQSDDLRAILVDVLQATNAEIEAVTGWIPCSGDVDG